MRRKPALLLVAALVGATSLLAPPAFAETADDPVDDAVVVTTAEAPAPVEGAPEPAPDPESDPADPEPSRDVADDTDAPPAPAPTPQPAPAEEEAPDPTGEVPPPDPVEQSDPVVEEDPVVGEPTEEDPVAEDTASTIAGVTSSGCLVTVSVNTADDWANDLRVTGTTVDGEAYEYVTELSHAATGITVDKSFPVDEAIDGSLTVELLAEGAVVDDWTGDLGLEECAPAPDNTVIRNVTVDGCEVTVTLLVGNDNPEVVQVYALDGDSGSERAVLTLADPTPGSTTSFQYTLSDPIGADGMAIHVLRDDPLTELASWQGSFEGLDQCVGGGMGGVGMDPPPVTIEPELRPRPERRPTASLDRVSASTIAENLMTKLLRTYPTLPGTGVA